MVELGIRPLERADVPHVVDYWCKASRADLDRMGVDAAKIPAPETLRSQLEALAAPQPRPRAFYMVWLLDGKPVGYTALKNIVHGQRADMHLHMWEAPSRGKGYGARLFCMSALDFFARFGLKRIVCEPSASNPMPNSMLRGIGFPLVGTRFGASSELSTECQLNVYEVNAEVARRFLASAGPTAER